MYGVRLNGIFTSVPSQARSDTLWGALFPAIREEQVSHLSQDKSEEYV